MLDARGRKVTSYRRKAEVITGEAYGRRWTSEEKARIAAESFEEGANVSEVALRNGVSRGMLTCGDARLRRRLKQPRPACRSKLRRGDGGRAGASGVHFAGCDEASGDCRIVLSRYRVVELEMTGRGFGSEPGVVAAALSVVRQWAASRASVLCLYGPQNARGFRRHSRSTFAVGGITLVGAASDAHAHPDSRVFVFRSSADRVKLLAWDGSGWCW